jgi:uncharacterized integral membrane protein (TIGR00698 family)
MPGRGVAALLPGLLLCAVVTGVAAGLQSVEITLFGRAWIESLVLAILVGTAVRTAWTPGQRWQRGIAFCAKPLLEFAVVLLGASVSAATILAAGPALLVGIAAVVVVALGIGYGLGRLLGLRARMATLVACGNAICGNSAIAAVAPVIGATAADVAASIAFTAVLGVITVLTLPLIGGALQLSTLQYGTLAGLTVYAVPQVLAATAPAGVVAVQVGTLVKLVRVLMLGPVCLLLSVLVHRQRGADAPTVRLPLGRMVPWFIVGFVLLVVLRSFGLIPALVLAPMATAAALFTIVAMAALGLGVDIRVVARAGARVTATVTLSLLTLGAISYALIRALGVA